MADYAVTRYEGGRAFPNGKFGRKAEAEKHAEYVRGFHGCNKGDVKVSRVASQDDLPGATEADETTAHTTPQE